MYEFKLPDIGEGLSEAELLEWTVSVGDRVTEGDEVATISTDKVNVELSAPASGVVVEIFGEPGDIIDVGTLIMRIDNGVASEVPEDSPPVSSVGNEPPNEPPSAVGKAATTEAVAARPAKTTPVRASPVARRYAAEKGVDLSQITGTSPGGQVSRADVDAALEDGPGAGADGPDGAASVQAVKLTGPRLAAAQHLAHGHRIQVTTTITFEASADGVVERLEHLRSNAHADEARPTPMALIAECVVANLKEHPRFNATICEDDTELLVSDVISLGLAVDTEDGLMVPVAHGVENMSVSELATEIARLGRAARGGDLELDEVRGSTFTLSSTGGLERATITGTTPIINHPNVATLWVSRIRNRPRVIDGESGVGLGVGPMMSGSLSFDHRYLHGADGLAFINTLVEALKYE